MILFDTNILVAAARTADVNHHIAVRLLNTMSEPRLVPPTVVAEVCYLLSEWGGPDAEVVPTGLPARRPAVGRTDRH